MDFAILFGLLLTNGLFAMAELALISSKPARLQARADEGDTGAAAALDLLKDPSRLLSAVQIGITLVGVFAGAFGAAAFSDDLAPLIAKALPQFAERADAAAFAIVVVAITFLSLVVGELVPKRIALAAPEAIASLAARPMQAVAFIAMPAVAILRLSTEGLVRLLGLSRVRRENVSEEEILHVVAEGASAGAIDAREREMIEGVLDLADRNVRSVMTPRHEVLTIDVDAPQADIAAAIAAGVHSRLPVIGAAGDILGVIQTKDLLRQVAVGGAIDPVAAARKPVVVPETMRVARLLDALSHSEVRMAIVVNEHGDFEGVVTAADILGAIAGGAAFSPTDRPSAMTTRADGSWLVDGATPIEDFERVVGERGLVDAANYSTVAGLVIDSLQRMAAPGDRVSAGGLVFEVVDMDGRRIDTLLVTAPEIDAEEAVI